MDSDPPPLYVVHHPEGRLVAFDRHTPAVTLALLLSAQVGRPVVLEVGRRDLPIGARDGAEPRRLSP